MDSVTRVAGQWLQRQAGAELDQVVAQIAEELDRDFKVFRKDSPKGGVVKILEGRRAVGWVYATDLHMTSQEKDDHAMEQVRSGIPPLPRRRRASYTTSQCRTDFDTLTSKHPQIQNLWFIGHTMLDVELRRRGLGNLFYAEIIQMATKHRAAIGPGVCAGEPTKPAAFRVWNSIRRRYPHEGFLVWGRN
jgi:hypothetical protein